MAHTHRRDKNKKAKPQTSQDVKHSAGMLMIVEGETEEAFFEDLKSNPLLKGVACDIGKATNIDKAVELAEEKQNDYSKIWIVSDNDKRNAYSLEEKETPFFQSCAALPEAICKQMTAAYHPLRHKYFLSTHDYLHWLQAAIGAEQTIAFCDAIQHHTPHKNYSLQNIKKTGSIRNTAYRLLILVLRLNFGYF